jgi:predicted nucleotidyltransferase
LAGLSLNEYCARKLAEPGAAAVGPGGDVVARAAERFGHDLVGVLVFGSWARGDEVEESDVDLLVVLDPGVAIVRSLYRAWDATKPELTWDGRRLEVHFVRLPPPGETPTGLWAEAALDGLVLFDQGFELSRRLVEIRGRIAAGVVRRRRVHGQSYWVGGE